MLGVEFNSGAELPWTVPLVLLVILAASGVMFSLLVWRWTVQRQWLALADWAEANAFTLHPARQAIFPEVLSLLVQPPPRVLVSLHDPDTTIVQIETSTSPGPTTRPAPQRWNLLIRRIESAWPVTCLKPVTRPASVVDFLPLTSMHAVQPGERFVIYGSELAVARALGKSPVRALVPPDVGLILWGHYLILDFSTRPFDPLALQRLDSLAEQVVAHLGAGKGVRSH